jgi:hypothetical protein
MNDDPRAAALEEAVRRFGEAWARGDGAALDALLSPTYTHTDAGGGFLDRAAWLAYARQRAGRTTQIAFRDIGMRFVGDAAIVTGINEIEGVGARSAADTRPLAIRFTQVWIWRDGRWLREAFQATTEADVTFG